MTQYMHIQSGGITELLIDRLFDNNYMNASAVATYI